MQETSQKLADAINLRTLLQGPLLLNERLLYAADYQHTPFNGGFEYEPVIHRTFPNSLSHSLIE